MNHIIDNNIKNIKPPYRIVFMGTPEFAVPTLKALLADTLFSIEAVITQADKKIGRQQLLSVPPVKQIALDHGLMVLQPTSIKEVTTNIKELKPDLIVVIAYAKIIPAEILAIPQLGCINVHASLLPRHRGASCIQAAILAGDQESGVTFMKMDIGLDTGAIIYQIKTALGDQETSATLSLRLSALAGDNICPVLVNFAENGLSYPQDESLATMTKLSRKEDALLDWSSSALLIDRQIRAMYPWPGAYSYIDIGDKRMSMKIIDYAVTEVLSAYVPGTYLKQNGYFFVSSADRLIELKTVQLEGKKMSSGHDFVLGYGRYLRDLSV